ncbi:MAG: ParB/RepB/Spo0J family partition protein [Gammaproteobacteria bacterium]|nr:ParB/RepB/Spo0J family partition protein [Gammaproteobacteria bacterium]
MSKKKRFGISAALTRGLSETINVVENDAGIYRNVVLPLSRIELDPENPRKLHIDLIDVLQGIRNEDPFATQKYEELERLKELAHTIQSSGVINPIVVYKRGEHYRVVAGERRCLAALIAQKQEIDARVFNERPKGFDLKLIQWIENTAREDLTLNERLGNVRDMIEAYQVQNGPVEFNATLLRQVTGLSLSQTTYYLAAMNAPDDVKTQIEHGKINSLDKAALLANVSCNDLRKNAINACLAGSTLKELRSLINQKKPSKNKIALVSSGRGRTAAKVNMGHTRYPRVVKTVIECVMNHSTYQKYNEYFAKVDWADLRQTTKAFKKLIEILEAEKSL